MKKILLLSVAAAIAIAGCKKKEGTISQAVTVSYPVVTITSPQYISIPVGGLLPNAGTISATAYDTFYKKAITPVIDDSKLNNLVPGLYIATVSARNENGFVGYNYVYVAVTGIPDTINLAGRYLRPANGDTVAITKLARGLYRTNNVGGELTTSLAIPGYFVQTTSTDLDMPMQNSPKGYFAGTSGVIRMLPADTTIQYVITGNTNFNSATRVFRKL